MSMPVMVPTEEVLTIAITRIGSAYTSTVVSNNGNTHHNDAFCVRLDVSAIRQNQSLLLSHPPDKKPHPRLPLSFECPEDCWVREDKELRPRLFPLPHNRPADLSSELAEGFLVIDAPLFSNPRHTSKPLWLPDIPTTKELIERWHGNGPTQRLLCVVGLNRFLVYHLAQADRDGVIENLYTYPEKKVG